MAGIRSVVGFAFFVEGDGVATQVSILLEEAPFNFANGGNRPNGVEVVDPPGTTGVLTNSGRRLALTFAAPPPAFPAVTSVTVYLFFPGA